MRCLPGRFDYVDTIEESCQDANVVVLATEWPEFRNADPQALRPLTADPLMIDVSNTLDADQWRQAGWNIRQMGQPC